MTLGFGIIGCGSVCEVKSGPAFQKATGSRLTAVMRRDGARAEDFARRHGALRWYTDVRALVADPEVDVVYVATPPGSHLELALLACAAGKPAYVEKPMARNYAECRRMQQAFAAAGVPLFVAYYRRALPRFVAVKARLDAGALGTVRSIEYTYSSSRHRHADRSHLPWRLQAEHSGGGLVLDVGSHALDLLDFFFGPLQDVHGTAENHGTPTDVEDTVNMTFTVPGGATGRAEWCFASDARTDRLLIRGTQGELVLSVFDPGSVPDPPHVQQPLIQTIVDELAGRGQCPSRAESAVRTSRVLDQVLAGYYGSREDAFWLRPESWPGRVSRG